MPDVKISALPAATVPLAGTEVLPIVQSATTRQVSVANLTAGRSVGGTNFIPSGSVAPTNGLYLPAANSLGFSTNSTNVATIDASGNLGIGVTPTAWSGLIALQIGQAASLFAQSGGNFIGGYVGSNIYFNSGWKYIRNGYATKYDFNESNNGQHRWWIAPDNTSGAGAAATEVQVMTLNASGGLQVLNTIGVGNTTPSTSGAGITFPATQSASSNANTLDDYEEGEWTPTDGSGASLSFTSANGKYTKIGRAVFVEFRVTYPVTVTASNAVIASLPFTNTNNDRDNVPVTVLSDGATVSGMFNQGATDFSIFTIGTFTAVTNATLSTKTLRGSGWYVVS